MANFHYYPARVDSKRPLGVVNIEQFVEAIKNPNPHIRQVFKQIAESEAGAMAARASGDLFNEKAYRKIKDNLKQQNLFYFTPCVFTDGQGRGYSNIQYFNGIAVLDFDHIDNAEKLKNYVFFNYNCVICAFLSPSKKGVKFLIKIPKIVRVTGGQLAPLSPEIMEFKEYYYGLGAEFERFKGWDGTGQNCILPLFLSYDPDILYRGDAIEWTKKGKVLDAFKASTAPAVRVETDDEKKRRIYENIKKAFDLINDNGHPQVRAAGVSLGGYVSSGYLSQFEAEEFIFSCIRANAYLSKGVDGYCKTARTAVQTGLKSQLFLRD